MGKLKIQMERFYGVSAACKDASIQMNKALLAMKKEKMSESFFLFGLHPVMDYMDRENVEGMDDWSIQGFVRYMDTYLVELSGGKRSELARLGKDLTGIQPTSVSMHAMRHEIIRAYLKV